MKKRANRFVLIIEALVIGFAIIAFWRGIWGLLDIYLFPNYLVLSYLISVLIGILILILTRNLIRTLLD